MTIKEAFQISDILSQASPASQTEIASFAFIKRYEKGQHIFYDLEEVNCLYILLEGIASLYKTNSLAEMAGPKRETVSRQMKKLTELDLIRMEKNRILVPDLKNKRLFSRAVIRITACSFTICRAETAV